MTVRIALVGAGSVGRRHVDVLHRLGGARVVSVTDAHAPAAEALASELGAAAFADAEEALDAVAVDAVYVCVPPFAHGPAEHAALDRGRPLFVEKPVGLGLEVAEQVAARVEATGVVTGTGYHWRCLDTARRARRLLEDAPPLLANGYWLDKRPPVPWWGRTDRSGGQIIEQATHVLDTARYLLGEVEEVYAAGVNVPPADADDAWGDVDDATATTLRFRSGAVATLAATSALPGRHRAALHVVSRGRYLEVSEESLTVHAGIERHEHVRSEDPRLVVDREFLEAVRGERESTRVPYGEALRTHRLACAIAESARTGVPVRLGLRA
ncbi:Gfo/Idh/MocA family oxidoreductase [Citricoccus sp. SGAir0253]|uniref:Gfo/Idh/MocA family protein n=1 Tax=Citricoccus sp. SGAir0253 TaxID=2567881 RepID=UPI0010CD352E|nr:Gfo/Idh/MocA family oxidoreductase [Citricoccus sp. SGAir0253]QCU76831.1 Gfo/Idh/MocA family oxidoreductase [Citricoccus sp. SGAir0253]